MKLFKFFLISLLIIFSFSNVSLAVETTKPSQNILASVNIVDAKLISSKGNTFNISFNLSNKDGLQSGVKYGIKLFSQDSGGYMLALADEKIYDEVLTLQPNSNTKKEITYTAPNILEGNYTLVIYSENDSGFPFGINVVGKVKLVSSVKGVKILTETCSAKLESNKSKELILTKTDSIRLTCTGQNTKDEQVNVVPFFESNYNDMYGKTVIATGGDTTVISFNKLEKKTFSILLPRAEKPGYFYVRTMLKDGNSFSNSVGINYTVDGVTASIQNVFFDKDYYAKGDIANLSVLWFSRGKTTGNLTLKVLVTNLNDKKCGKELTEVLSQVNGNTKIPFPITTSCVNPTAVVSIVDSVGNILDQKTFTVTTKVLPKDVSNAGFIAVAIIILVLIVAGVLIYLKKKKGNGGAGVPPQVIAIFLLFVCVFIPFNRVKAYMQFDAGNPTAFGFGAGFNKSVYSPVNFYDGNSTATLAMAIYSQGNSSGNFLVKIKNCPSSQTCSWTTYPAFVVNGPNSVIGPETQSFSVGNIPGTYKMTINIQAPNYSTYETEFIYIVQIPEPVVSVRTFDNTKLVDLGQKVKILWDTTVVNDNTYCTGFINDIPSDFVNNKISGESIQQPTGNTKYDVKCYNSELDTGACTGSYTSTIKVWWDGTTSGNYQLDPGNFANLDVHHPFGMSSSPDWTPNLKYYECKRDRWSTAENPLYYPDGCNDCNSCSDAQARDPRNVSYAVDATDSKWYRYTCKQSFSCWGDVWWGDKMDIGQNAYGTANCNAFDNRSAACSAHTGCTWTPN